MKAKGKIQQVATGDKLQLAFDVGHSSIGWAVLQPTGKEISLDLSINILGCGVVTYRADDCLASARRAYRRQRRHIRSTRQRIARLKIVLAKLGVLSEAQLNKPGCAWPWLLAARVLTGGKLLTWPELWDVLRWYAHNRGYDGNQRWSKTFEPDDETLESDEAELDKILNDASVSEDEKNDAKKVKEAKMLMRKYATRSMAETFCKELGLDPKGKAKSSMKRFKGLNAAFPRKVVEKEVRQILKAHFDRMPKVDAVFERMLMGKDNQDKFAWQAIPCPELKLPKRYQGGLLFGQLVPRFNNRIISTCPITYSEIYDREFKISGEHKAADHKAKTLAKVPSRNCPEFWNFRWGMQLANIRIACAGDKDLRDLTAAERNVIDQAVREKGGVTPFQLKLLVREKTKCVRDDLDQMLMVPDIEKALILDPVQKLACSDDLAPFWKLLPERLQKRLRGKWRHGKVFTLAQIRSQFEALGDVSGFDAELQNQLDTRNTKTKKKDKQITREELLQKCFPSKPLKLEGRAPFARHLLKKAYEEVLAGRHPKAKNNCLFLSEEIRKKQQDREIAEQTNNHLVRHRLRVLVGDPKAKRNRKPGDPKPGLVEDIVEEFAGGDKTRISKITIEVNRDLREMSGKDSEAKGKELHAKLWNIRTVEDYVKDRLPEKYHDRINGSFLRKARVADDLNWKCPYTGETIQPIHLITGVVDLDHIVPFSIRPSNSLDSLVVTFSTVNKMKGKRTAMQFMQEMAGQPVLHVNERGQTERVEGMPGLSLMQMRAFKSFLENIKTWRKGEHEQDTKRRERKKKLLELESYEEKEFLPGDLTQTSQLVRLAAQALQKNMPHLTTNDVVSLPGSVTGSVRKAWKLEGCLSLANPAVLDEDGESKTKTEIRDISHLHHALDACVLGIAAVKFPNLPIGNQTLWQLLVKRKYSKDEQRALKTLGLFDDFDSNGSGRLNNLSNELKEQVRQRLAEKRVVQHIPAELNGMPTKETVWRIFDPSDTHQNAKRIGKWLVKAKISIPAADETTVLIIRRKRRSATDAEGGGKKVFHETNSWRWMYEAVEQSKVLGFGSASIKLRAIKGGKLIEDNYGIALYPDAPKNEPKFLPVRFFKVWQTLQSLPRNKNGKTPPVLRRGQLIMFQQGRFSGKVWRVLGLEDNGKIRFFSPDSVRRIDKPENYERVMITSLLKDKIQILRSPLTGVVASREKTATVTSNETSTGPAGAPDGGGHPPGGGGIGSPLQARAEFLKNWDWNAIIGINRGACQRGGAQHGINSEAGAACAAEWEILRSQALTLGETFDRLRAFHRKAPFLFFNGNTFATIGRELSFVLFSDLVPGRKREVGSAVAHYIAGVLDREPMEQIIETLSQTTDFNPGDRVKTLRGSLHGVIIRTMDDGRVIWKPDGTDSELTGLPESLIPE